MAEQEIAECSVEDEPPAEDDHLADIEDGCGCTEVWEHLSENRADD